MSATHPPLPLHDTPTVYGRISRLAHWIGVLMVLTLLALGLVFEELPKGSMRAALRQGHVALGMLCLLPLLMRIVWRLQALQSGHTPRPLSAECWMRRVERGTHLLLLFLLLLLTLSGPLAIWADGDAVRIVGSIAVPSPIEPSETLQRLCHVVHAVGSKLLIALLILHLAGMLRHGRESWNRMAGQID